ncbi:MAG: sulfate adenylyltransferase subunit CysD [Burkholderiales bacterium]|nr:sulfate adenylyltransferase subunit CysD [Burkholderiales bacterium]
MTARDAFLDSPAISDHQLAHDHGRHLDWLEDEAISILREVFGSFERPAILCSCGKDSLVVLHLAQKAAAPGKLPVPIVHIDTGHNFSEVISFREHLVRKHGLSLIVGHLDDSIAKGTLRLAHPLESRNPYQTITLLETIEANHFDAVVGGARRDEEKARAKERVFSHRDNFGQWQPRAQRPELWTLYNTRVAPGEHFRVFPISNWTELDVWNYIARANIELPSIYYTHPRQVVERNGLLVPVTDITPPRAGETVVTRDVRFRTVGDISCTCPVASRAATADDVILETITATASERGATRMDDRANDAAMERRKKEGYF